MTGLKLDLSYCSFTAFDLQIFVTNTAGNQGAFAAQVKEPSAVLSLTSISINSASYEFGWPGFDISVQTNKICLQSTSIACVSQLDYEVIYITTQPAFNSYSNLQCVSLNPVTIGFQW
jgi:hypothetical protein